MSRSRTFWYLSAANNCRCNQAPGIWRESGYRYHGRSPQRLGRYVASSHLNGVGLPGSYLYLSGANYESSQSTSGHNSRLSANCGAFYCTPLKYESLYERSSLLELFLFRRYNVHPLHFYLSLFSKLIAVRLWVLTYTSTRII